MSILVPHRWEVAGFVSGATFWSMVALETILEAIYPPAHHDFSNMPVLLRAWAIGLFVVSTAGLIASVLHYANRYFEAKEKP